MMSKMLTGYLCLMLAIIFEVIGTIFLQKSRQFTNYIETATMFLFYILSFYFLSQSLKVIPISVAYAIWGGLGIILTATAGVVFFKQTLDFPAYTGITFIVVGVFIVNFFSKSIGH